MTPDEAQRKWREAHDAAKSDFERVMESRRLAETTHSDWPQYVGRWNGWKAVRANTDIRGVGGAIILRAGDCTVGDFTGRVMVFSPEGNCDYVLHDSGAYLDVIEEHKFERVPS